MTKDDQSGGGTDDAVGYGKPPKHTRFKKGRSGNPKGRPPGKKTKPHAKGLLTNAMILEEAYRPVRVRDGEKVVKLPMIQAMIRSMGFEGMKGDRHAQRLLTELVLSAETKEHEDRMALFKAALEYKTEWEEEIEYCKRQGLPVPEPLPHPDDIILDPRKGTVRFAGPLTKEDKAWWDGFIDHVKAIKEEIAYLEQDLAEDPQCNSLQEMLRFEEECYQRFFDLLPERWQRMVEDEPGGDTCTSRLMIAHSLSKNAP